MRREWVKPAAIVAGLFGVGLGILAGPALESAQAQRTDVTELASRAIGGPGGGPRVGLLPGQLASNLPLSLPLPSGATVVGTVVQDWGPGAATWEIVLDVPGAPMDAGQFYEQSFPALGWTAAPGTGESIPPGFFCQSADGPWAGVVAVPVSDQGSDVRVHLESGNPGPCAGPPPQP